MNWRSLLAFACVLVLTCASTAVAQQEPMKHEAGRVMVSIYKVVPGKQVEFVKWMAAREAAEKEAGAMPTHWFTHMKGADWDFVSVSHLGSEKEESERAAKVDEILKKKGVTTGIGAWLEFRQIMAAHTDTLARGPYTASELLKEMEKK